MKSLIRKLGGAKKVSELLDIPIDTVQSWSAERRKPSHAGRLLLELVKVLTDLELQHCIEIAKSKIV